MDIKILGNIPSGITPTLLQSFLKKKGVPSQFLDLPQLYRVHGSSYGVRWDLALFQACLETAWFKFGNDVKSSQNNFAGIGATGGGVPGESFSSKSEGVRAQMQILAIRPGLHIKPENMISKRYREKYYVVFGKQTYWHQLAGTWAADLAYWDKIQSIAREFRTYSGIDPLVEVDQSTGEPSRPADSITWWEFNRTDDGRPVVTGYIGSIPATNLSTGKTSDLIEALQAAKNAGTYLVAPTETKIIPQAPEWPQVKPAQEPSKPTGKLQGMPIFLDAGHSQSKRGASGLGPDRPDEWQHNVIAAMVQKEILEEHGAVCEYWDPDPDNLVAVGQKAQGKKVAIFNHHNAANKDGKDEGHEVYVHPDASAACKKLAALMCKKIAEANGSINRGVKTAKYTVLVEAHEAGCEFVFLPELYFIDDYGDVSVTKQRTTRAAKAIAEAVVEFFGGQSSDSKNISDKLADVAEKYAKGTYKESDGTYDKFRKRFHGVLGSKNWPWCGAFVHYCLCEASGRELPINPKTGPATFALVETWQRWAEKYGYKLDPRTYAPERGDIVLFDWEGAKYPDVDYESHIGVFLRMDGTSSYVCAEGNVQDQTAIKSRSKSNIQWLNRLPDDFRI